ncbi:hypothetical protein LTR37_008966 [Vermiconidia calcicola]|uniref:Uncharacterized protein n=1 Tax=Vermiconidia calcicola TaxID=1690605 RepID=A0ACC3NAV1_9PEZI|nr:hypothetical protein LTR37_008966 [Vermiconidia calcicola]
MANTRNRGNNRGSNVNGRGRGTSTCGSGTGRGRGAATTPARPSQVYVDDADLVNDTSSGSSAVHAEGELAAESAADDGGGVSLRDGDAGSVDEAEDGSDAVSEREAMEGLLDGGEEREVRNDELAPRTADDQDSPPTAPAKGGAKKRKIQDDDDYAEFEPKKKPARKGKKAATPAPAPVPQPLTPAPVPQPPTPAPAPQPPTPSARMMRISGCQILIIVVLTLVVVVALVYLLGCRDGRKQVWKLEKELAEMEMRDL